MGIKAGAWTKDPWSDYLRLVRRVERHARIVFRDVPCTHRRDDLVQEAIALGWKWYLRLLERGKSPWQWPTAFATFVVRAVADGRRVVGVESDRDPLSWRAHRRRDIVIEQLEGWGEALVDDNTTPVPDQVAFRLDFPAWLQTRTERDQAAVGLLAVGTTTGEAAALLGVSAGRVSQIRRELAASWKMFA